MTTPPTADPAEAMRDEDVLEAFAGVVSAQQYAEDEGYAEQCHRNREGLKAELLRRLRRRDAAAGTVVIDKWDAEWFVNYVSIDTPNVIGPVRRLQEAINRVALGEGTE